ncbi:MAG: polyprenyl synthetase family protein [Paludibacteraceae bacterium]|nr:polyprenyl synthetase family protein [Paludibacteraceae bacterium]
MTNPTDIRKPIALEFHQYEEAFASSLQSDNPVLQQVLDYIYSKRGKQLRPMLVLLSAALCRGITDKTTQTAVALEMMHTASLVHDDVVDDSSLRRGSEAVHTKWTNKIAVLAGDYMLTRVMSIVTNLRNISILNIVADMGATLTSGELLQLHAGESMWISEKQYNMVIEKKTACLFAACSEAGAASTGATLRQMTALRQYGLHLGMCFQIKDDVLDFSDIEDIGKPTMNDVRDGKATLPLLISLQRASREEATYIKEIAEGLATKAAHIDAFEAEQDIKSFVLRHNGIRYAHQEMEKHRKKAIEALSIFPDNKYKTALLALLDYAINRMK